MAKQKLETGRWGRMKARTKSYREAAHGVNGSDEWYTPISLIRALGAFDLDPACGSGCPNRTAARRYRTRGIEREWSGRVWLNPPFSDVKPWVEKMIAHDNGVMLVFARADAKWFQTACRAAGGVYLLHGRVQFERPNGTVGKCPLGCVLFGFGDANRRAIQRCGYAGLWLATEGSGFRVQGSGKTRSRRLLSSVPEPRTLNPEPLRRRAP